MLVLLLLVRKVGIVFVFNPHLKLGAGFLFFYIIPLAKAFIYAKIIPITMSEVKARSFVTIMVVIAVASLFLRFGSEQLIKINIVQNESIAEASLKLISTALENYAKENQGIYPANFSLLTKKNPAYLDKDYIIESPIKGYNYSCPRLEPSGYSCSAQPTRCGFTGKLNFTITTGGSLGSEECSKKE